MNSPLTKLIAVEQAARAFGFEWPNEGMIIDQIIAECQEIKEALGHHESPERIQEEVSDLLHAAFSLCIFIGFDVEETIDIAQKKFKGRFEALQALAQEHNLTTLKGQSVEQLLILWKEAKKRTKEKEAW